MQIIVFSFYLHFTQRPNFIGIGIVCIYIYLNIYTHTYTYKCVHVVSELTLLLLRCSLGWSRSSRLRLRLGWMQTTLLSQDGGPSGGSLSSCSSEKSSSDSPAHVVQMKCACQKGPVHKPKPLGRWLGRHPPCGSEVEYGFPKCSSVELWATSMGVGASRV